MLFQNTVLALLASASVVLGAAFPGGDKDKTTCSAEYKTKTETDYYKSTILTTESRYVTKTDYSNKYETTKVPYPTTKTVYVTKASPTF